MIDIQKIVLFIIYYMSNWRSGQFVLDTKENRITYGPFVIFTNDDSASIEKNLLDFYLKLIKKKYSKK